MDLFKRLPKLRPPLPEEQHLIPLAERSQYPAFTQDFEVLDRELMPRLRKLDNAALIHQNWYRWMYVILIFGSALISILVIVQLVVTINSIGIIGAIIATFLGVATLISRIFMHHERYLNARLATEFLRGEYFMFLGRFEPYVNEQDRVQRLIEHVADIAMQGERPHVA